MTAYEPAGLFKEGDFIALFKDKGHKITRTIISIDQLLPQLSREDLDKVSDWITRQALMDPETDEEYRRELLSRMDTCPCCQRWLGHNNPPADAGELATSAARILRPLISASGCSPCRD